MNIKSLFASLVLGSALTLSAYAQHAESGDAGDMPETAQATGTNTTTALPSITGTNSPGADVDMYAIYIADPDNFQANTNGTPWDTQLWLFDANGKGVKHDDDSGDGLQSLITGRAGMQPGTYYIAVSKFNRDAVGCSNATIWGSAVNTVPNGADAGSRVTGWVNAVATEGGAYIINLTGCNTSPLGDDPADCPPPPRTWDEASNGGGDAGDLPGTAQKVYAADADPCATEVRITGTHDADDVDMYIICITDPASFQASTGGGATWDTQLWLFRCDGTGVTFNDDAVGLQSTITGQFITEPGIYLLAVSRYDRDALDADGNALWNDTPFGVERAPDGPGAANPVSRWDGTTAAGGAYTIAMRGAFFVDEAGCDEGPPCPEEDVDGDCCVNDADLLIVLFSFGDFGFGLPGDINGDFVVNDADLLLVLFAFGEGCE
ncbi:MAG: pre-peptidase C-terminal domain-containing protein [Fimbriimonadia bacterium]|nr:pre-peptidase C-terminal domain-containing protein [Fimbriimonadia bacterium]